MRLKYKIHSITCRFDIGISGIDRKKVSDWLGGEFDPKRFRAPVIKFGDNKAIILYGTGKGVIAGFKSFRKVKQLTMELAEYLRINKRNVETNVVNMVASCNVGKRISLDKLAAVTSGIYMPGVFPNLHFRLKKAAVTAIVSGRGKISLVGAKTENDFLLATKELENIFKEHPEVLAKCPALTVGTKRSP
jgi:TATA-box binding protein (TBP) (component of TFIID and TFIIIB)